MKILFLTDNFPPERNVPATRTWEHVSRWANAGHDVTVITTVPNFPEGKAFEGYQNRWYTTENMGGVHVIRVKSYIAANEGFLKRTLDHLSFMFTGGAAALVRERPDVLVSTSPQFFCAVAGWLVSRLRSLPWVFELRDLWPASIVAVGAMKDGWVIRALSWLEMRMYRDADRVVAVTNGLKADLVERGIEPSKISVIRNGCDIERFSPRPKDEGLEQRLGLHGKFVVGYLGTIGMGAGVGTVVKAARLLKDRPDIMILLAGAGAEYDQTALEIKRLALTNIRLLPAFGQAEMPAVWSLLDAALVMMKDRPLFRATLSSKTFEALAMGKPVIMSMPAGEATGLVDEYGFGLNVAPEDPQAMAKAIRQMADDADLCRVLGNKAHAASRRFSRTRSAQDMLGVLDGLQADPVSIHGEKTPS